MDLQTLAQIKELGIALVAVLCFAYICKYIIDLNKETSRELNEQLKQNREDYTKFVLENNHHKSDIVEKSTSAMVKVGEAINAHTKAVEKLVDKLS